MKIALCGTWHVHASGYFEKAMSLCEISGVYEENEAFRKAFCRKYNVREFETFEELLSSDADGVIVCTATNSHPYYITKIAEAKKNIFTEKVLALTENECLKIEDAIKRNGVNFTISFPFKFQPGPMAVKQIVDSGELGKINYVRFRNSHSGSITNFLPEHFYNRQECGGGAMIDLGAHGMYLIDWLSGLPEKYSSTFTHCFGRDVEDNAVTVMSYHSGLIAVNETGFVSGVYPKILEVGGEAGYVRFTGAKESVVVKSTRETKGEVNVALPEAGEAPIIQFLTGRQAPGCGIEEAKNLTIMMQNAYSNING